MRFAALVSALPLLFAACSEGIPARVPSPNPVREFGVCIDVPNGYAADTSQVADFYLVEIADAATGKAAASVYIGYSPEIESGLLNDIEEHRAQSAGRSPLRVEGGNSHPGAQYLGVPSDRNSAYFHVMFGDITERQQSTLLQAITFCG